MMEKTCEVKKLTVNLKCANIFVQQLKKSTNNERDKVLKNTIWVNKAVSKFCSTVDKMINKANEETTDDEQDNLFHSEEKIIFRESEEDILSLEGENYFPFDGEDNLSQEDIDLPCGYDNESASDVSGLFGNEDFGKRFEPYYVSKDVNICTRRECLTHYSGMFKSVDELDSLSDVEDLERTQHYSVNNTDFQIQGRQSDAMRDARLASELKMMTVNLKSTNMLIKKLKNSAEILKNTIEVNEVLSQFCKVVDVIFDGEDEGGLSNELPDLILAGFKNYNEWFLKSHFNPNDTSCGGESQFELAFNMGNEKILFTRGLLERGASIHKMDDRGLQPIHWAARQGKVSCLDEIIYYVDKSARDFQRRLLLNCDAYKERGEPISLKMPLNHFQRNVDVRDGNNGSTPLQWAAMSTNNFSSSNKYSHIDMLHYLLEHGANLNVRDYGGNTPLHLTDSVKVAFHLIFQGACDRIKNRIGETPLDSNRHRFWKKMKGHFFVKSEQELEEIEKLADEKSKNIAKIMNAAEIFDEQEEIPIKETLDEKRKRKDKEKKKRMQNEESLREVNKIIVKDRQELIKFLEFVPLNPQFKLIILNQLKETKRNLRKTTKKKRASVEREILKLKTGESVYVNELLSEHYTTYFLCKFKRETDDIIFFSRIRENIEHIDEMFHD